MESLSKKDKRSNHTLKQKFMSFNDQQFFQNNQTNGNVKSDSAQVSVETLDNIFGLREFID